MGAYALGCLALLWMEPCWRPVRARDDYTCCRCGFRSRLALAFRVRILPRPVCLTCIRERERQTEHLAWVMLAAAVPALAWLLLTLSPLALYAVAATSTVALVSVGVWWHELGHSLCGRLVGVRVRLLRVGSDWLPVRRFNWMGLAWRVRWPCLNGSAFTFSVRHSNWRHAVYVAGGPLLRLLAALAAGRVAVRAGPYFLLFSCWNGYLAANSLTPYTSVRGNLTDGGQLLLLLRSRYPSADARLAGKATHLFDRGEDELVLQLVKEANVAVAPLVITCLHRLGCRDEAVAQCRAWLATPGLPEAHRVALQSALAWARLWCAPGVPDDAEAIAGALEDVRKSYESHPFDVALMGAYGVGWWSSLFRRSSARAGPKAHCEHSTSGLMSVSRIYRQEGLRPGGEPAAQLASRSLPQAWGN